MAYLTREFVRQAIGTAVADKVAVTTSDFSNYEQMARTKVRTAGKMAGYSLPNTDTGTSQQLRDLALGQFVLLGYGLKKGLEVGAFIADQINLLEMVRSGAAPLLDYTPNVAHAIGGIHPINTGEEFPRRFSKSELEEF